MDNEQQRQRDWDQQRQVFKDASTRRRLEIEKGAAEELVNGGLSNAALARRKRREEEAKETNPASLQPSSVWQELRRQSQEYAQMTEQQRESLRQSHEREFTGRRNVADELCRMAREHREMTESQRKGVEQLREGEDRSRPFPSRGSRPR